MRATRPSPPPPRALTGAASTLALLLSSGCSVLGIRTAEEAPYEVLEKQGAFEIRRYPELVVVETVVGDERSRGGSEETAFFRLFDYIRGANAGQQKIDMTAPVLIEAEGRSIARTVPVVSEETEEGMRMSFVLPADLDLGSAPAPEDSRLTVRRLEGARIASLRYSGSRSEEAFERRVSELRRWLTERGIEPSSQPRYAGYDPPFTIPFFRRHEVWIELL